MTSYEFDALTLSALIAAATVLLCFPVALWVASWAGRQGPGGRWTLDALLLMPLALSPAVVGWAVVTALAPQSPAGVWLAEWTQWRLRLVPEGLILINLVLTLPLMIRTMRPAFETVDHSMVLTARTLGASRWSAWWSITVAQTSPMLLSAVVLGFAAAWGECGASMVVAAALQSPLGAQQPGAVAGTVPLTLMSAMQTTRGQDIAWRMSMVSLGVAALAMLGSEWARRRWRRRALPPQARGVAA
ncbi:MAG TPA: ABC transporter permease subunit [Aquabacterium sp.]|uniref:molybdate ABC transporter permease subunit n=1 Tax=Aquabacterium sp. TaxID=1872578 RepID=UPI002E35B7C2|nr:ABC transporter permease subunit [Aquabacterium sp.]HEX5372106.1 ABC transporter permease subunit [Aquabacterium sp.]